MTLPLTALLTNLMRPPGGGIPVYSAGKGSALELQRKHYSISNGIFSTTWNEKDILQFWKKSWDSLERAKVALIGVPSDTGAGIRRGAAYGPQGVRQALLELQEYQDWIRKQMVVDLGDVYVNPHLLYDEMLSAEQIRICQNEMYPAASEAERSQLSVSALSQVRQILEALAETHPNLRVFVMGGDHSIAWPVTEILARRFPKTLGIVQPDAHTDLLPSRLGVKYCFGTWSFHANELLGRNGKLVQLGIRQSGKDKKYWETTTGVKQIWAQEIHERSIDSVIEEIVSHLKKRQIKQIYFSNDIDGTDESEASATGTPAPEGLKSEFVLKMIEKLGTSFELVAADIMEVAPDLGPTENAKKKTCALAARYALACLKQQV